MNILESQVTDLNYLAESPIIATRTGIGSGPLEMNSQQRQSSSTESPADMGNGSGKKRKVEDRGSIEGNAATHTRAKRNRYISIAWYVLERY